jgi:hypothetical protein
MFSPPVAFWSNPLDVSSRFEGPDSEVPLFWGCWESCDSWLPLFWISSKSSGANPEIWGKWQRSLWTFSTSPGTRSLRAWSCRPPQSLDVLPYPELFSRSLLPRSKSLLFSRSYRVYHAPISISRYPEWKWITPDAVFRASNIIAFYVNRLLKSPHPFLTKTD